MNRLTDDRTAEGIKHICDGLIAAGAEPTMSDRRYIRLAEYEQTGFTPEELNELYRRVNGAANILLRGKCGNCKDYELCDGNVTFCPTASARSAINDAPTADVEPVRHGRWGNNDVTVWNSENVDNSRQRMELMIIAAKCSLCGKWAEKVNGLEQMMPYDFCPHCGAKMDGGESNE